MLNQRWYRSLGTGIPIISAIILFGIGMEVNENLFQTGITPGIVLGIANVFLGWAIYKNKI